MARRGGGGINRNGTPYVETRGPGPVKGSYRVPMAAPGAFAKSVKPQQDQGGDDSRGGGRPVGISMTPRGVRGR